jgi:hypothetical protein
MRGYMQWSGVNHERPKAERQGAPGSKAKLTAAAGSTHFPPKATVNPFVRPPDVTSGQLLRISLLILAALIYCDPSPFNRFVTPAAAKFAVAGIDPAPTGEIPSVLEP